MDELEDRFEIVELYLRGILLLLSSLVAVIAIPDNATEIVPMFMMFVAGTVAMFGVVYLPIHGKKELRQRQRE
jgi:hypothetical protein